MKKIIVTGCGGISNFWINPLIQRADCRIAALVDNMIERAKAKREEHGLNCNVYTTVAKACENEDAEIVFDITPPEYHFETVTTALKAG